MSRGGQQQLPSQGLQMERIREYVGAALPLRVSQEPHHDGRVQQAQRVEPRPPLEVSLLPSAGCLHQILPRNTLSQPLEGGF